MKQVQIDQDLFADIIKILYFEDSDPVLRESVKYRLRDKVGKMARRQEYSRQLADKQSSFKA